jgi:hypothetical protein
VSAPQEERNSREKWNAGNARTGSLSADLPTISWRGLASKRALASGKLVWAFCTLSLAELIVDAT